MARLHIRVLAAISLFAVASGAVNAHAETHIVRMMSKTLGGARIAFFQSLLIAAPSDVIRFEPVDKGHNVQSIKGMASEGAAGGKGKLNKSVEITLTKAGVYGYKCLPHFGMGMVGLIIAGDPSANLDAAKAVKQRGRKPNKAFKALFNQLAEN